MTDSSSQELIRRIIDSVCDSERIILSHEAYARDIKICERLLAELRERTITLCGSTKFPEAFAEVNSSLTKKLYLVYSVGTFVRKEYHDENNPEAIKLKIELDKLHKQKINRSFAIVVLNKNGYIGTSTKSEIDYARINGKKIYWLEDTDDDYNRIDSELNYSALLSSASEAQN